MHILCPYIILSHLPKIKHRTAHRRICSARHPQRPKLAWRQCSSTWVAHNGRPRGSLQSPGSIHYDLYRDTLYMYTHIIYVFDRSSNHAIQEEMVHLVLLMPRLSDYDIHWIDRRGNLLECYRNQSWWELDSQVMIPNLGSIWWVVPQKSGVIPETRMTTGMTQSSNLLSGCHHPNIETTNRFVESLPIVGRHWVTRLPARVWHAASCPGARRLRQDMYVRYEVWIGSLKQKTEGSKAGKTRWKIAKK